MPETQDTKIAMLQQRVDDLRADNSRYEVMLSDWSLMKDNIARLHQDIGQMASTLRELRESQDAFERLQEERQRKDQKDRVARWLTVIMLFLTFMSSATAVAALVVH
jgi:hypothetical protein